MSKNSEEKNNFRDEYYNNIVRTNIIRYRKFYKLTQAQLAELLDCTVEYLSQIESPNSKANCPIYLAADVTKLFRISFKDLFNDSLQMPDKIVELKQITHKKTDIDYVNIARDNVRKYRGFKLIKQQELSNIIAKHTTFIAKLENRKHKINITISTVGRIADALQIPIEKFFEE